MCLQPHTHTHTQTNTHPPSLSGSLQMIWVCFSPGSWVLESSVAVIRKLMWLSPCAVGLSVGRLVCPFCVTLVVAQQGDWGPYHSCHFPSLCVSFGSLSASIHSWKDRALAPCFTKCPRARRTLGAAWPLGSGAWGSEGGWDGGPPRQAWRGPGWPLRCSGVSGCRLIPLFRRDADRSPVDRSPGVCGAFSCPRGWPQLALQSYLPGHGSCRTSELRKINVAIETVCLIGWTL